jgi:hypothetical protein
MTHNALGILNEFSWFTNETVRFFRAVTSLAFWMTMGTCWIVYITDIVIFVWWTSFNARLSLQEVTGGACLTTRWTFTKWTVRNTLFTHFRNIWQVIAINTVLAFTCTCTSTLFTIYIAVNTCSKWQVPIWVPANITFRYTRRIPIS